MPLIPNNEGRPHIILYYPNSCSLLMLFNQVLTTQISREFMDPSINKFDLCHCVLQF